MSKKKNLSVGVDLGTSNLLIYVEGQGTLFNEPSVIAIDKESQKIISVGYEAAALAGKTHDKVEVIHPLHGGVITDTQRVKQFLLFVLDKILLSRIGSVTRLLICIPSEITETEKSAILELGSDLGIKNTVLNEEIKAAAVGSGVDIFVPNGHMVIDIGGGTADFGILSLGAVVLSKSLKVAGNFFDKQIIDHVKAVHKLEIGLQTAEAAKIKLASLTGPLPVDDGGATLTYTAMGRDVISGLPKQAVIEAQEIRTILLYCFESIKSVLLATLEATPPELAGDIVDNGILLSGGCSQIRGISEYFEAIAQVPVTLSAVPMTAVVDGCKKLIKLNGKHFLGELK